MGSSQRTPEQTEPWPCGIAAARHRRPRAAPARPRAGDDPGHRRDGPLGRRRVESSVRARMRARDRSAPNRPWADLGATPGRPQDRRRNRIDARSTPGRLGIDTGFFPGSTPDRREIDYLPTRIDPGPIPELRANRAQIVPGWVGRAGIVPGSIPGSRPDRRWIDHGTTRDRHRVDSGIDTGSMPDRPRADPGAPRGRSRDRGRFHTGSTPGRS